VTNTFPVTGDDAADELLERDPLALLIGMLLDQQIAMELAFKGPHRLRVRLGGELDAAAIAGMPTAQLRETFAQKPALHRFHGSMAERTQDLCQHLVETYHGEASRLWEEAATGGELLSRLRQLPGFGEEKARIFTAVLAKRFGVTPPGWEEAAGRYADDQPRSVADIDSPEMLAVVRDFKREQKARRKLGG
jgi:uncharacterized HhH-GPD family protein